MPGTVQWKITGQIIEQTRTGQTGQPQRGKVITFQLSTGQQGTVFVPDAQFTPDGVKAAIQPIAENLDSVYNVTSGP